MALLFSASARRWLLMGNQRVRRKSAPTKRRDSVHAVWSMHSPTPLWRAQNCLTDFCGAPLSKQRLRQRPTLMARPTGVHRPPLAFPPPLFALPLTQLLLQPHHQPP